jgi:hypothetical protein
MNENLVFAGDDQRSGFEYLRRHAFFGWRGPFRSRIVLGNQKILQAAQTMNPSVLGSPEPDRQEAESVPPM